MRIVLEICCKQNERIMLLYILCTIGAQVLCSVFFCLYLKIICWNFPWILKFCAVDRCRMLLLIFMSAERSKTELFWHVKTCSLVSRYLVLVQRCWWRFKSSGIWRRLDWSVGLARTMFFQLHSDLIFVWPCIINL